MLYIIENGELKEVTTTNSNIEKLRKKELYSIQHVHIWYWAVFQWNKYGDFWQQVSKEYIDKGWALNFLKRKLKK